MYQVEQQASKSSYKFNFFQDWGNKNVHSWQEFLFVFTVLLFLCQNLYFLNIMEYRWIYITLLPQNVWGPTLSQSYFIIYFSGTLTVNVRGDRSYSYFCHYCMSFPHPLERRIGKCNIRYVTRQVVFKASHIYVVFKSDVPVAKSGMYGYIPWDKQ